LFLCGVFIGATLTVRRYSSTENSNSGDEENPQAKSVPNWKEINEVLSSPRVGKYVFFFILISIILTGGLWGAGQVGVGPLAPSYEISGQVVDQGEPVEGVNVTIKNSTGDAITTDNGNAVSSRLAETNDKGKYTAELPSDGTYNVEYGNETYEGVEPGDSNIDFPKDQSESNSTESEEGSSGSLIPDWVPGFGSNSQDSDSETTDSGNGSQEANDSRDSGSGNGSQEANDSTGSGDNETIDEGADSQSIPYIQGKLEGEDVLVKFVNVTVLNQDGDEITSTRNESDINGNYRIENVPSEAFHGDIENGEVTLQAKSKDKIKTTTENIDLGPYEAETGVDSANIEIEEN
jgi:hypothetical protein